MPVDHAGFQGLRPTDDWCDRVTARDRLWRIFRTQADALKTRHHGDRAACFIGIRESVTAPNVLFRAERCIPPTVVIALTVTPEIDWDQLVFRIHTVTIRDGSVSGVSADVLPVWCDAHSDRFIINTTPPIDEPDMADFFLQRAERLVSTL